MSEVLGFIGSRQTSTIQSFISNRFKEIDFRGIQLDQNQAKEDKIEAVARSLIEEAFEKDRKSDWQCRNKFKWIAYFPIAGTAVGLGNFLCHLKDENLPNRTFHLIRDSIEMAGLGFLLIIPDLIFTLVYCFVTPNDPPPFGFEFEPQRNEHWKQFYIDQFKKMEKVHTIEDNEALAMNVKNCLSEYFGATLAWNSALVHNVMLIVGYVPIVGLSTGIQRLQSVVNNPEIEERNWHIMRGVAECAGLGSLYLIPDLIATGYFELAQPA